MTTVVHVELFVEGRTEVFHDEISEGYTLEDLKEDYRLELVPHTILESCSCTKAQKAHDPR